MRGVAEAVLASTGAAVLLVRQDGSVATVNPSAAELLGAPADVVVGQDAAALLARPREVREMRLALLHVARTGTPRAAESRLPAPLQVSGRSMAWQLSRLDAAGSPVVLVGIDITSTRSQLDELHNRALTDELTGLANRAQLVRTLDRLAGTGATVAFCDLNGFKAVNDTHGHAAGDEVLVEVARRFVRAVRGEDVVARLGGDEFVVVAPADAGSSGAGLQRRIAGALRQPMLLSGGLVVLVGVAVGLATLDPGVDPAEVLEHADSAMYAAKPSRASRTGVVAAPR